jgi:hypothetical protein
MIAYLPTDLVLQKICNHLVLSCSMAPYSIGVLQVCEVLILEDWVLIFHLAALMVKKQITSLDHEGCKMEGRAPH